MKLELQTGTLTVHNLEPLDFCAKRIYWLSNTRAASQRGQHALKSTTQIMVAVSGSVVVELANREGTKRVELTPESDFLLIPPRTWRVLENFESGTIVVVMADTPYREDDYIRNYQEFLRSINE